MSELSPHRYTFRVTRPAKPNVRPAAVTFDIEIDAHSHAEGLNAVLAIEPHGSKAYMVDVRPAAQRCADERCAVCYPSRRNSRSL